MLSQEQKKKETVLIDDSDLMGEAVKRSMARLINAIQAADVTEAVEAWRVLCSLEEAE